jgi:hypothetical protein
MQPCGRVSLREAPAFIQDGLQAERSERATWSKPERCFGLYDRDRGNFWIFALYRGDIPKT